MRIAFLGFGLIGGSIARALRERGRAGDGIEIVAWSPSGRGTASGGTRRPRSSRAAATPLAALDGADLVVLAGPPPW
jgi:prephenate dehydrogenase